MIRLVFLFLFEESNSSSSAGFVFLFQFGANAILAGSFAVCKAGANFLKIPIYKAIYP